MPRPCAVCGSRKFRRDAVTGSAVCEEGHVLQDFRSENHDADGPSQYTMQRRNVRKNTDRGEDEGKRSKRNQDYYTGEDAEYLRLQATQLLLRLQVQALGKLWALPDVFELIMRDLWAYHLSTCLLPPPPERDRPRTPSVLDPSSPALARSVSQGLKVGVAGREEGGSPLPIEDDAPSGSESGSGHSSDEAAARMDEEILQELEMSDRTDVEDRDGPAGLRGQAKRGAETRGKKKPRPRVADTVMVLSMGLWMVRRGSLLVDLESAINLNLIPFLDFARSTLLPPKMKRHMNRDVVAALSPSRCPKPENVFHAMRRFARVLSRQYGISLPEANLPQVAWAVIQPLGGTPMTYSQVMRLLALCDVDFSLDERSVKTFTRRPRGKAPQRQRSLSRRSRSRIRGASQSRRQSGLDAENDGDVAAGRDDQSSGDEGGVGEDKDVEMVQYEKTTRYQDVFMPELTVAAGWVVVMKMAYGLDDLPRQPTDEEPVQPDGKAWVAELQKRLDRRQLIPQDGLRDISRDFVAMKEADLDRYLDTAQGVLLRDRQDGKEADIADFPLPFPTAAPLDFTRTRPAWSHDYSNTHSHTSDSSSPPPAATPILRPGECIRSYDPKDITGTLPTSYATVLNAASTLIGVTPERLAEVVQILERRLERERKKGRRASLRGKYGKYRPKPRWGSEAVSVSDKSDGRARSKGKGKEGSRGMSRQGSEASLPRGVFLHDDTDEG